MHQSYLNGNPQPSDTQDYDAADYTEFKANGIAEAHAVGLNETFPYSLVNNTLLIINGKRGKINMLTANTLSYTLADTTSAPYYIRFTYNFYR